MLTGTKPLTQSEKCSCFLFRVAHSGQEQPSGAAAAAPENSAASGIKATGSVATVTGQDDNSNSVLPHLQPTHHQHHNQQQQHINEQLHFPRRHSHQQQQPWRVGLLQPPHLAQLPRQPFSQGHMLGPLNSLANMRSILGPTPFWIEGLNPAGALVLRIPQAGPSGGLMRGYHNPAGQGGNRYRGGHRGGFNGM